MSLQQDRVISPYSNSRSNSRSQSRANDYDAQRKGLSTAPVGARRSRGLNSTTHSEFVSTPPRYPYCYQPENAFQALQDKSKGHAHSPHARGLEKQAKRDYHIPGYTGYVRGSQHVAGRTYGEATRKAMSTSYRENVCTSPIPSGPQANGRVKHDVNPNSFVAKVFAGKQYHLPGYTGYVPGVQRTFAKSYGNATGEQLARQNAGQPKSRGGFEKEGYAQGMRNRQLRELEVAPLPGMTRANQGPPRKMIPNYVGNLAFMAGV